MTHELKIYQSKTRLIAGGTVIAVFVVALAGLLISGPDPDSVFRPFRSPTMFYPIFLGGLALFLYLAYFAADSLRNPKPRVILTNSQVVVDGFAGRFSADWSEFSGFALHNKSTYVLQLKDVQSFTARQLAGRPQQTAQALPDRFGSPFLIEAGNLDVEMAAVREFLAAHLQEVPA